MYKQNPEPSEEYIRSLDYCMIKESTPDLCPDKKCDCWNKECKEYFPKSRILKSISEEGI